LQTHKGRNTKMEIKAVLFDLDGTLLPMDQEEFTGAYFKMMAQKMAPFGYEPGRLIDNIWAGTAAMIKNDGSCTNEEAFWRSFAESYGEAVRKDIGLFDEFYRCELLKVKEICGFQPLARHVIDFLKEKGKTIVLATNPIFPAIATQNRMRWAGLAPEDFVFYTTYENSRFCKPNPQYYADILRRISCEPEQCLMVGNDAVEDMAAQKLGINVFLITDCLCNKHGLAIDQFPNGSFADFKLYLESMM